MKLTLVAAAAAGLIVLAAPAAAQNSSAPPVITPPPPAKTETPPPTTAPPPSETTPPDPVTTSPPSETVVVVPQTVPAPAPMEPVTIDPDVAYPNGFADPADPFGNGMSLAYREERGFDWGLLGLLGLLGLMKRGGGTTVVTRENYTSPPSGTRPGMNRGATATDDRTMNLNPRPGEGTDPNARR